jgi:hypothetical protein
MIFADRIQETTTTTGTGTISLNGATFGHSVFSSSISSGSSCLYLISTSTDWEIGKGVFTSGSPSTLTRSVKRSSNSNNLLNLSNNGAQYVSQIVDAEFFNSFGWEIIETASSRSAEPGQYTIVTSSGQTITFPSAPVKGYSIKVGVGNFADTVINRNGKNIMGLAENMTIDKNNSTTIFQYISETIGWRIE